MSWRIHHLWTGCYSWLYMRQPHTDWSQQYCQWLICTEMNRIWDQHSGHNGSAAHVKWFIIIILYFFYFYFFSPRYFSAPVSLFLSKIAKRNWCSRQTWLSLFSLFKALIPWIIPQLFSVTALALGGENRWMKEGGGIAAHFHSLLCCDLWQGSLV